MGTERLSNEELEDFAAAVKGAGGVWKTVTVDSDILERLVAEVRASRAEPTDAQIREAVVAWLNNKGKSAYDQMAAALVAAREATEDQ